LKKIAIYGKGGSGKSTITSNLASWYAQSGRRTVQIGCDPKHDSTLVLMGGRAIPSVISMLDRRPEGPLPREEFVAVGAHGVACIEAGGPEAGVGCAGRGIISTFTLVRKCGVFDDFDVVLLDVLGDVVCGGFAVPLMHWSASTIAIVIADNLMSMYAANNIARAIVRYSRNGTHLAGLIANDVQEDSRVSELRAFAARIGTRLIAVLPHDPRVRVAERERRLVLDHSPDAEVSRRIPSIAQALWEADATSCPVPTPMDDRELDAFFRSLDR
jgi:nitrogenase iron protein NifH